MATKEDIDTVFKMLQNRAVKPSGTWDKGGRFYAHHDDLVNVRSPSRAYPYSQWHACHTRKYVVRVVEKFNCQTVDDILKHI